MKKTILIKFSHIIALMFSFLVLFCCAQTTNAQTFNNTIVNDNSSWATLYYEFHLIPYVASTEYLYFEGDSTVNGNLYKKVFSCDDSLHANIKYTGLIREENKKTYFILDNHPYPGTECLLYDFSLEEGMSFEYSYFCTDELAVSFYVNKVDSIEVNGLLKKRIKLTDHGRLVDVWVEGIGSMSGLLNSLFNGFLAGTSYLLLCYFQDHELIYKSPLYSECYYDDPGDIVFPYKIIPLDDNYSIFPNPVDHILTVSSSKNIISRIEIYDMVGKKVYSQANSNSIDVSSFSKGLYLLKVYDINDHTSVFKIIKK
jgi:hypothetical protein